MNVKVKMSFVTIAQNAIYVKNVTILTDNAHFLYGYSQVQKHFCIFLELSSQILFVISKTHNIKRSSFITLKVSITSNNPTLLNDS